LRFGREVLIIARMSAAPTPASAALHRLRQSGGVGADEHACLGRRTELATCAAAAQRASSGRGSIILISGSAGVGKTCLADAAAAAAADDGHLVAWGRCHGEDGAPPYWPWRQALDSLLGDPQESRSSTTALELAQGDTPLRWQEPSSPADRFHLFDGVRQVLRTRSASQPLTVVLDDLHHADEGTLDLLQFIARELRGLRLLVIGTYRPLEAKRRPAADRLIATAAREGRRIALRGLDDQAIAALLDACGHAAEPALAAQVAALTDGNPLLVRGLAARLTPAQRAEAGEAGETGQAGHAGEADEGRALSVASWWDQHGGIPEELRALVREQVELVPPAFRPVLTSAALVGPSIDIERLRLLEGLPVHQLLQALGAGVGAGLLVEETEHTGRFRFRHELLRELIAAELEPAERVSRHQRMAELIEERHAQDLDPHLDDLAHHRLRAASLDPDAAIAALTRAARRADRIQDVAGAERHYRTALDLVARSGAPRHQRVELLCELGTVLERSDAPQAAQPIHAEAVEAARDDENPLLFARTVLRCAPRLGPTARDAAASRRALVREALERVGSRDKALRSLLLAQLVTDAPQGASPDEHAELDRLTREAVALAREVGDPGLIGQALVARQHSLWRIDDVEERLANATEILQVAEDAEDDDLALQAHTWRLTAFLALGDPAGVDREIAVHARLAEESGQAHHRWSTQVFQAMRAMLDGRYTDAERHANEALRFKPLLDQERRAHAALVYGIQLFSIRKAQGRLLELADAVVADARAHPTAPLWRTALAYMQVSDGQASEAAAVLDELALGEFEQVPMDGSWLLTISLLAEISAFLGDERHSRTLYDLLLPHAGTTVVVADGANCRGAVAHYLGLLAGAFNDHGSAVRHFETAMAVHDRLGVRRYQVKSRLACASSLQAGGRSCERAEKLLLEARDIAVQTGMRAQLEAVESALRAVRGESDGEGSDGRTGDGRAMTTTAISAGTQPAQRASIIASDGRWIISFDGVETHLKEAKGLRYLSRLLANPDTELHAIALEQAWGSAGGVLDRTTAAATRQRFDELRSALEEAESYDDHERAALMRERLHKLAADLAAAAGLGDPGDGRAERARLNVTRALRTAMRNIADKHPALGRHLSSTIRTGMLCTYRPDPRAPLSWHVEDGTDLSP
jgi:hypothetical protein